MLLLSRVSYFSFRALHYVKLATGKAFFFPILLLPKEIAVDKM